MATVRLRRATQRSEGGPGCRKRGHQVGERTKLGYETVYDAPRGTAGEQVGDGGYIVDEFSASR